MMTKRTTVQFMLALCASAALLAGCKSPEGPEAVALPKESFGTAPDGSPVDIYTLRNSSGMEARIMTYGGIIVSLKVPDRNGVLGDVVLGHDDLTSYVT